MSVYATMCGCVWVHESVQGVAVAPLVLSGNFFFLMPHCEDNYSYINTFCHSPADDWVVLFMSTRMGKAEHLMWTRHKDFTHSNFNWKWRTFFLATVLGAPVCSLILFDWPSFDLDKKGVIGPPGGSLRVWRHFRILFALWATPEELLYTVGAFKGAAVLTRKCCMQHLLGDWLAQCFFTQIFLSRPKWDACGFEVKRP